MRSSSSRKASDAKAEGPPAADGAPRDRRSTEIEPLPVYEGHGTGETYREYERFFQHNDGTALYTLPGVMQFVKFLVDVSRQTSVNEYQVFPACLIAMTVDRVEKAVANGTADDKTYELLHVVGKELSAKTRQADKAGRFDRTFVILLTRTVARPVRDHYLPRMADHLKTAAKAAGHATAFSFGVASLTEHLIRDPDDLLRKALRALQAAQRREQDAVRRGAATAAAYDFRTMPGVER